MIKIENLGVSIATFTDIQQRIAESQKKGDEKVLQM